MDAMIEQEKDAKLYEIICRSLLSDKDMRKVNYNFLHIFFSYSN
jgi:hypothetical protein